MTASSAASDRPTVPPAERDAPPPPSTTRGLWFGFLGAAAAWSVQEIASFALVAHTCFPRLDPLPTPSAPAAWTAALIVTLAALAVCVAALLTAARLVGRLVPGRAGWGDASAESHRATASRYLAFGGVLMSMAFGLLVLYNVIALFGEPTCR